MKRFLSYLGGMALALLERGIHILAGPWGEMPDFYEEESPDPTQRCDFCGKAPAWDLGPFGMRCRSCTETVLRERGGRA